jgi:hypothetical protein
MKTAGQRGQLTIARQLRFHRPFLSLFLIAETKRPQHMGKQKGPNTWENKKAPTHGKTKRPQDTKTPIFYIRNKYKK